MPFGIPNHYEYMARKVCLELLKIEAPPDKKDDIIRLAAHKAVEVTHKRDKKLAKVICKEIKKYYPDINMNYK